MIGKTLGHYQITSLIDKGVLVMCARGAKATRNSHQSLFIDMREKDG